MPPARNPGVLFIPQQGTRHILKLVSNIFCCKQRIISKKNNLTLFTIISITFSVYESKAITSSIDLLGLGLVNMSLTICLTAVYARTKGKKVKVHNFVLDKFIYKKICIKRCG